MSKSDSNLVAVTLKEVCERALKQGLAEFLLIGGNAVIAHGVPRFTRDIDFVVPERVLPDWRRFLEAEGHAFLHATPAFAQFWDEARARPRIDLMIVDESTWETLSSGAGVAEFDEGIPVPVAAADHLIAMKLKALKAPGRRADAQDWSDIIELTMRSGFDPQKDESFRDLVLHFGSEELLSRLVNEIRSRAR